MSFLKHSSAMTATSRSKSTAITTSTSTGPSLDPDSSTVPSPSSYLTSYATSNPNSYPNSNTNSYPTSNTNTYPTSNTNLYPNSNPNSSASPSSTPTPKITDDEFRSILALFERVITTRAHADDIDVDKLHTAYLLLYPLDRPCYMETKVYQWLYGQEWDIEYEWFLGRKN